MRRMITVWTTPNVRKNRLWGSCKGKWQEGALEVEEVECTWIWWWWMSSREYLLTTGQTTHTTRTTYHESAKLRRHREAAKYKESLRLELLSSKLWGRRQLSSQEVPNRVRVIWADLTHRWRWTWLPVRTTPWLWRNRTLKPALSAVNLELSMPNLTKDRALWVRITTTTHQLTIPLTNLWQTWSIPTQPRLLLEAEERVEEVEEALC